MGRAWRCRTLRRETKGTGVRVHGMRPHARSSDSSPRIAAEFRDLTTVTMVTRGARNLLTGRLRAVNRMPLDVTVVGGDD